MIDLMGASSGKFNKFIVLKKSIFYIPNFWRHFTLYFNWMSDTASSKFCHLDDGIDFSKTYFTHSSLKSERSIWYGLC